MGSSPRGASTFTIVLALALVSCGSPGEPKPVPPIAISLAQDTLTVLPGRRGLGPAYLPIREDVPVVIERNGYSGAITFSADAASPIDVTVGPHAGFPGSEAVLGIVTPSETPSGDHTVRVHATAGALGTVTATLQLRVRPFDIELYLDRLIVSQGATNRFTVASVGSTPVLSVTVAGPPGVTASVPSNLQSGPYVEVTAAADASPGSRVVTVTATAAGYEKTREIEIVVQPAHSKRPIAFRMCRANLLIGSGTQGFLRPHAWAYQNDGEAWTIVTPDANDYVRFDATDRVAIAEFFTYPIGLYAPGVASRVIHITADELEQMQCPSARAAGNTFTLNVAGASKYFATAGAFRAFSPSSPASIVGRAMPGPLDLVASATRAIPAGSEFRAIVRRDVDLPNGATIDLDFTSSESFVLDSATYSIDAGDAALPLTYVHTPTTIARLGGVTPASGKYWAVPEGLLDADEVQSLLITSPTRGTLHYFRAVSPIAASFGPELSTPVADVETRTITLTAQPEYPHVAGVGALEVRDFRGVYYYAEVWQTSAYAGGTPAQWLFSVPDFAGTSLGPRLNLGGALGALGGGGPAPLFFGATAAPGTTLRWARRAPQHFGLALPFPTGH